MLTYFHASRIGIAVNLRKQVISIRTSQSYESYQIGEYGKKHRL